MRSAARRRSVASGELSGGLILGYRRSLSPEGCGLGCGGSDRCRSSAATISSTTPSIFCITSLFQKRRTKYPIVSNMRVRFASASTRSACCPPSSSMIRRASTQKNSTTKRSIGNCLLNFHPPRRRSRRRNHSFLSASVCLRRSFLAIAGDVFMARTPSPRPSPLRGEGGRRRVAWRAAVPASGRSRRPDRRGSWCRSGSR